MFQDGEVMLMMRELLLQSRRDEQELMTKTSISYMYMCVKKLQDEISITIIILIILWYAKLYMIMYILEIFALTQYASAGLGTRW